MVWTRFAPLLLLGVAPAMSVAAEPTAAPPVRVMVVGTFHFDNPGLDYRNLEVDDVLQPERQREIALVVDALARFAPTIVGVEWRKAAAMDAYAQYRAGTLPTKRDESVQLGFRLAAQVGLANVRGLDTPMSLPFDPVFSYAEAHGGQPIIDEITRVSDANVAAQDKALKTKGIAATLRLLNDPTEASAGHGLYREILKLGVGDEQPGLEATVTWYRRNLAICGNLLQAAKPGDRVVVFFGAGHLPLLRQCVGETPGYELVETVDYLPASSKR